MAKHPLPAALGVREQLVHESVAMAQYALASGMNVSPATVATLEQSRAAPADAPGDIAAIVKVHDQLSKLVSPATPRALLLLGPDHAANNRGGLKAMLGSVGLVRRMMIAAIVSMVVYIAVGLSPDVNGTVQTVQNNAGLPLLLNELAWLAAAAMGASFAILMQVSGYVVKRNYDPRYEPGYWIKFFLGVMAGFILVQLVPLAEATGTDPNLSQLMLALLGGFSASAVFRILTRLVEAVESVFRGDAKSEIARRENDAVSRASVETSQVRMGFAAQVVRLQQEVSTGADPAALTARLREMLTALVPDSALEPVETPTPSPSGDAPQGTIALPGVNVVSDPSAADADAAQPPAAG
ncbi:MAG TPA: hypothetical protein VGO40_16895 [Longimicrobium sp.]|jgi:hypothetical protein|nr:hypothetical protein [Longimicrobium sp.]